MLRDVETAANLCDVGTAVALRLVEDLDNTRMHRKGAVSERTDVLLLLEHAGIA
ncbi:hypothetical protein [Leyella stercorea]|uniref:hypothetical protein n=1 Tax=Leyella stercorea TaxID=363265 RepID=UPI0034A5C00C